MAEGAGKPSIVCIGAGPAGLTAAYLLTKQDYPVTVLEKHPRYVGGISRTEQHKGYRFDIGGHRFFSKSAEVTALWHEMLGEAFITRPRKSRIVYRGKFYPYPLSAFATLRNLGIIESSLCMLSYLKYHLRPIPDPRSFQDWVTNQFGERLFRIFFKTYTEKVWGMPCSEISADWAAQRIKGLSLGKAVMESLFGWAKKRRRSSKTVKTLIQEFEYPRFGPGQMWEAATTSVQKNGGRVLMDAGAFAVNRAGGKWEMKYRTGEGVVYTLQADYVINSMPLSALVHAIENPVLSAEAKEAALGLRYRDFLVVGLMARDYGSFDDQWIYIHDPQLKVGRIQNFKSWSPDMVPDAGMTCYGLEYFCFEGDGIWDSADEALIEMAKKELVALKLAKSEDIEGGVVIRQRKAYPVYDDDYKERVEIIRRELEAKCPGLFTVGRNGMHRYNNQDHAMMTAMLTVRNIMENAQHYDVWNVNEDAEYHEEGQSGASGLRAVPQRLDPKA